MLGNRFPIEPDDLIVNAVQMIFDKKISGLPVIDAGGFQLGIVTAVETLRVLLALPEQVVE